MPLVALGCVAEDRPAGIARDRNKPFSERLWSRIASALASSASAIRMLAMSISRPSSDTAPLPFARGLRHRFHDAAGLREFGRRRREDAVGRFDLGR